MEVEGPRWHMNSCAIDTVLWALKVLDLFKLGALDSIGAGSFQAAVQEAVVDHWDEIIKPDHIARDQLAQRWSREEGGDPFGDFQAILRVWEAATKNLPATTAKLRRISRCSNIDCTYRDRRDTEFGPVISLGNESLTNSMRDKTETKTFENMLDAYFSPYYSTSCKQCKQKADVNTTAHVMSGELPAFIIVWQLWPEMLDANNFTARFRFYGNKRTKHKVYYRVILMLIAKHEHYTGLAIRWEGDEIVGGREYDGMKDKVAKLGKQRVQDRVATLRADKASGEVPEALVVLERMLD